MTLPEDWDFGLTSKQENLEKKKSFWFATFWKIPWLLNVVIKVYRLKGLKEKIKNRCTLLGQGRNWCGHKGRTDCENCHMYSIKYILGLADLVWLWVIFYKEEMYYIPLLMYLVKLPISLFDSSLGSTFN